MGYMFTGDTVLSCYFGGAVGWMGGCGGCIKYFFFVLTVRGDCGF